MAYTSIIPVSRLDNSITYIRNKDKTTKKGQSAGSLEEAIDYAMNRDKTERSVFEDAIGCVCETACQKNSSRSSICLFVTDSALPYF